MSYDIYMKIDTGGEEMATVEQIANLTWNVLPILDKAFGTYFKDELSQKTGLEALPIIDKAIMYMKEPKNVVTLKALNPTNGWGSYDGTLRTLDKMAQACRWHPKATLIIEA